MNPAPKEGCGSTEVLLHWLPLGAGGHVVAFNGRVYEAVCARRQHRRAAPLLHAALSLRLGEDSYAIEMGPAWGNAAAQRGVVVEGPVALRVLGRSRLFRYEVRAWRDGSIPDLDYAVGRPTVMSRDPVRATNLLAQVPQVPPLTWGRDELGLGEMWNSNSIIAWLLLRSGHDLRFIHPPGRGRAPGWASGVALALSGGVLGAVQLVRPRPGTGTAGPTTEGGHHHVPDRDREPDQTLRP